MNLTRLVKTIRQSLSPKSRLAADLKAFRNAKKVLDLGCGRGRFLRLLGERGVGIDGCRDSVDFCRNAGLEVHEIVLPSRLPFKDGEFDGVYFSHVIEHFGPRDATLILTEADRVLREGGILLVRAPLFSPAFFDDPTHVRPYHLHSVLHLLGGWEEAGSRQMIVGIERPVYRLRSYYEECYPLYTSSVAPTIAPGRFPFRLALRGVSHLLAKMHIGRKGAWGAVLVKGPQSSSCDRCDSAISCSGRIGASVLARPGEPAVPKSVKEAV